MVAKRLGLSRVPSRDELITRKRLAKTLRALQCTNGQALIDGWVAKDFVQTARAAGGILSLDDLAANQPRDRQPLTGSYRGWAIHSMGPPSSGGLAILQILSVLESTDLSRLGHNSSELLHLYAETFQHAFADRANFMGDPDRIHVPRNACCQKNVFRLFVRLSIQSRRSINRPMAQSWISAKILEPNTSVLLIQME